MIDFHSHLVPGVDDGAADLDEARAALASMQAQGVTALVTTPHLRGSLTERPAELEAALGEMDAGFAALREMAAAEFPGLRVERGHEVMLDTPSPRLGDPRLRLAGTRFVLVEFPFMTVPPGAAQVIFDIKMQGWQPVIAHPERYSNLNADLGQVEEWRRVGALLQVNGGSLVGRYGKQVQEIVWDLLKGGMADYLSSDFHARGSCWITDARTALEARGGQEQARLLAEVNPARLLDGLAPEPVPPLAPPASLWRRLLGRG
ncbi:MAG TPA: CpsB/CapC family capsule biosynthesis tyrosine phosphatase [Longimicrobiaceae bacterium]|nr:CpsB/CapC family capsule biosynthesis tyrosine phosphatase [Longimicrobiaceae bacterium]